MKKLVIIFCTLSCIPFLIFYRTQKTNSYKPGKLSIVCTTTMIADALANIGGDLINIYCLMGPGVDPHLYRAKESDILKIINADIVFYNGLHLEGKLSHLFEHMKHIKTIAISSTIPQEKLRKLDFENNYDPHIWFDVSLWLNVVQCICESLIEIDPTNQYIYRENVTLYLNKLELLDNYIKKRVDTIPKSQRILITAHDAFGYFGLAYGFQVVGLQGISTESEPSIKDIQDLAHFIADHKILAIFTESSIPERTIKAVQQAVEARGWHVAIGPELYSDSLGSPGSTQGTYIGMIEYTIDSLAKALSN